MGYDIPDEIKYKEKIIADLDLKQLGYVILFGLLAFFSYKLPIYGDLQIVLPALFSILGIGFIYLNFDEIILQIFAYYTSIRRAPNNSKIAQKFFEVKQISDEVISVDNKRIIAVLKVEPINFNLLSEDRRRALLENYRSFLNHLTVPIQILIRTLPVKNTNSILNIEFKKRTQLMDLYEDFRSHEQQHIEDSNIMRRDFYLLVPFQKTGKEDDLLQLEQNVKIIQEKLSDCGLLNKRLSKEGLMSFLLTYSSLGHAEQKEIKLKKEETSDDLFRSVITPSFDIQPEYAQVNGEFHKILKVTGYPRKVEDGWLQSFLTQNEGYDISLHLEPSTIRSMLVYLHNQIIQQSSDLMLSTSKGTPNPALEIKKADTMRVYDNLYKGEEKLFYVSLYLDNKTDDLSSLNLLVEKCKANLNSLMMIPHTVKWRIADSLKATMPLAIDKLESKKEFLTSSLAATFPFISPVDSRDSGILFAHELDTQNPIFIDFERMSNKHFFVIGISGSGKSYTSKYLLMQQLFKEDTEVYVLDPNGEYSGLCDQLGGQKIELSRESKSIINIFDLAGDDYGNKMMSLVSAFDIIVGGLTESQKSVLGKALAKMYSKKEIFNDDPSSWDKTPPTFSDLKKVLEDTHESLVKNKDYLQDPSVESLINRVEMYCKGGLFGFLDSQTKMEVKNSFACFDLGNLPNAVKPLCMFMVLDLIRRKVKKDLKPKVVLIDEGWSLLRSRESENYILEFIKTSRKYNTAVGFITQELEDLLNSSTGKSILNTASTKILMRQNPTNMRLISSSLDLNKQMENYLLTAKKGNGLLITEEGNYKFSVSTSPKIHALITTNPMDINNKKDKNRKLKIENKEVDQPKTSVRKLNKYLYLKNELNDKEVSELLAKGYVECRERLGRRGGSSIYLVKTRANEGPEHAFLVWSTYYLLKQKFKKVEMPATVDADLIIHISKSKKICFEIETGLSLQKSGLDRLQIKFNRLKTEYEKVYIVVADWDLKWRYANFGETITRTEIAATIEKIPLR